MRLDHVNIVVSDMERSCRFYGEVLKLQRGFEVLLEGDWIDRVTGLSGVRAQAVFFEFPGCGSRIELIRYETPEGEALPPNRLPHTVGVRHIAFQVDDMQAFVQQLQAAGIELLSPPVEVPFVVGTAGRKHLCYFYDPDGVLLEAASYDNPETNRR